MTKKRHMLVLFLLLMIFIVCAQPVNAAAGTTNGGSATHTYIVVYKGTNDARSSHVMTDSLSNPVPMDIKYNYTIINAQAVELTDDQANSIKAQGDVAYVMPDQPVTVDMNEVVGQVYATTAWSLGYTGKGVNISVIDSGIDATHPDLQGKVILWKDFLNNSTTPYDDYGHGTHVAGIIAGSGNASNGTYKGIAYDANLLCAKIINSGGTASISDMIAAIDWSVQNHANIISLSVSTSPHYQPLDDAVHNATASGVVVVCSAGNLGPTAGDVKCPADSPDAIAVGSVDKSDRLSSFSSRGSTWDNRTKPDIVAVGEGVVSASATGTNLGIAVNQYYTSLSGTSMSCPQVSATCAILLQANPSLTPTDIKNALFSSADRLSPVYPNNDTGWGRLNVGAALNEVLSGKITVPVPSGMPSPSPVPQGSWKTYVANNGGYTVSVIDQASDAVTDTITTGSGPFGITYSPDGSLVYVAEENRNDVAVISAASDALINIIPVGSDPRGVVVSPNGKRLYVSDHDDGNISVIDASNVAHYTTLNTISGLDNPFELCMSPDGNRLYVSAYNGTSVYVINTANDSDAVLKTLAAGMPYFISLDPAGTRLFVANYASNNISVYDTSSYALQATINTGSGPLSPIVSPDGSRLYYVTDGDGNLTIAYANNYTTIKTVKCGSGVRGIACSPDGKKAYVVNNLDGTVSIVNVANDAGTVKTVKVGSSPYGLEQFAGYYPSTSATPESFSISLSKGWNMISLPVSGQTLKASDLVNNSTLGVTMVAAYDVGSQKYNTYTGSPLDTNFPLAIDSGYFVLCSKSAIYTASGTVPASHDIDIAKGWNLIGWCSDAVVNASTLKARLQPNALMIAGYDSGAQKFTTYTGSVLDTNFNVKPTEGYFILSNSTTVKKLHIGG